MAYAARLRIVAVRVQQAAVRGSACRSDASIESAAASRSARRCAAGDIACRLQQRPRRRHVRRERVAVFGQRLHADPGEQQHGGDDIEHSRPFAQRLPRLPLEATAAVERTDVDRRCDRGSVRPDAVSPATPFGASPTSVLRGPRHRPARPGTGGASARPRRPSFAFRRLRAACRRPATPASRTSGGAASVAAAPSTGWSAAALRNVTVGLPAASSSGTSASSLRRASSAIRWSLASNTARQ